MLMLHYTHTTIDKNLSAARGNLQYNKKKLGYLCSSNQSPTPNLIGELPLIAGIKIQNLKEWSSEIYKKTKKNTHS